MGPRPPWGLTVLGVRRTQRAASLKVTGHRTKRRGLQPAKEQGEGGGRERPETQHPATLPQRRAHTDLLSQLPNERTVLPTRQRPSLGPRLTLGSAAEASVPGFILQGRPQQPGGQGAQPVPPEESRHSARGTLSASAIRPGCQACCTRRETPGT